MISSVSLRPRPEGEAVLVKDFVLTFPLRWQIFELAARHRLPTVCESSGYVVDGGLMSYGWDWRKLIGHGARYIDRILKGARPKDLPVDQASEFELVINLKTANALGITVPATLVARADKVIE
jgi:putative ABC transport system substrate-binding protein